MKITVVTPLFPPDLGAPAPYVKELLERLDGHEVTLVCYCKLPERVSGVTYHPVDKRAGTLWRLLSFTKTLWSASRHADVLYVQNGPSVALPSVIVSLVTNTPVVQCISDPLAYKNQDVTWFRRLVHRMIEKRTARMVSIVAGTIGTALPTPLPRPEIHPLKSAPAASLAAYETSWHEHLEVLINELHHATH